MKTIKGQSGDKWQDLAEAIREELRECAWLLSLLDKQQKAILSRDTNAINETNNSICEQSGQVAAVRESRIALMMEACGGYALQPGDTLMDVAELMPEVMRPLFHALARESASLRRRIQRRTEQNRRILERAHAGVSELLEFSHPGSVTRTYGRLGGYHTSTGLKGSVLHTVV